MPKIGPGGNGGGGRGDATVVPAGEYVLAIVWFKRNVGKSSGQDYLRLKIEVCGGPLASNSFFANISCDPSKEGTRRRWELLMESCGVTGEWEIGSTREGTASEGDRNIRELFVGKPFKAKVKLERDGQYENNDIAMIVYPSNWTPEDKQAMDHWVREVWGKRNHGRSRPEDDYDDPEDLEALPGGDEYDDFDELPDDDTDPDDFSPERI